MNTVGTVYIVVSVIFGAIALVLACVGIGTPHWQSTSVTLDGQTRVVWTANFFYSCRLFPNGTLIACSYRISDRNINQYYPIDARDNQTEWNRHLDTAAGLSIAGIIFIFIGTLTTLAMLPGIWAVWMYLIGPICLFVACLFMLAGMAEGSYVLYYNDYAANLYQTGHALAIFSFAMSCMAAGRFYTLPEVQHPDMSARQS